MAATNFIVMIDTLALVEQNDPKTPGKASYV